MAKDTVPVDENGLPEFIDTRADGTAIAQRTPRRFTDEELQGLKSFDDFANFMQAREEEVASAVDFGHGFQMLEQDAKRRLVDQELVIIDTRMISRDDGDFAVVYVITRPGEKFMFLDGSTGIYKQLVEWKPEGGLSMHVPHGLRASDYKKEVERNGRMVETDATTFYIATDK